MGNDRRVQSRLALWWKLLQKSVFATKHHVYARSVLSVCVNSNQPFFAKEYRAEFIQAVSALEGFSGPRILQLDGYSKPNCTK